jgi:hypothetical protein
MARSRAVGGSAAPIARPWSVSRETFEVAGRDREEITG